MLTLPILLTAPILTLTHSVCSLVSAKLIVKDPASLGSLFSKSTTSSNAALSLVFDSTGWESCMIVYSLSLWHLQVVACSSVFLVRHFGRK